MTEQQITTATKPESKPAATKPKSKPAATKPKSKPAQKPLTPLTERQTDIPAADVMVGDACPFTEDCPGTVVAYSTSVKTFFEPRDGDDDKCPPRVDRREKCIYLHCPVCRRLPINPKLQVISRRS